MSAELEQAAMTYARSGWRVFPLRPRSKFPATRNGLLDATTDPDRVAAWWARRGGDWNIGLVPPRTVIVIDIDPRHAGDDFWDALCRAAGGHGPTHTVWSGRGDGGRHLYFKAPPGPLSGARFAKTGIDLKTHRGYVLAPPSIHPDTGLPYRTDPARHPIADCPAWLAGMLHRPEPVATGGRAVYTGDDWFDDSIADRFCTLNGWADILGPAGWSLHSGGGDEDGSRWTHPAATQAFSATVRDGRLYVYSPNTAFEQTQAEEPHGYSKFDAYALLVHGGDRSGAARTARRNSGRIG